MDEESKDSAVVTLISLENDRFEVPIRAAKLCEVRTAALTAASPV